MKQEKRLNNLNRRKFAQTMATSSLGFFIIPRHVLGGKGFIPPSDKVSIGVVGVGGRGKENTADLLQLTDVNVVALADPAEFWDLHRFYYRTVAGRGPVKEMIEKTNMEKGTNQLVTLYEDFRVMLAKETSLDGILCATPDHNHAYVAITAMRAGKHVYCEKPLTHNIWEARMVQKVAKETGLATQMGNQMHSTASVRDVVEHLRAGVIGEVEEIHSWVPATRWDRSLTGNPTKGSPVPQGFNWDLWLGPRTDRPFHETYAPVTWRDYWDFGCGALGDFGCHDMDAAVWGLQLPLPSSVEVLPAGFSDSRITPYGEIGYYHFPSGTAGKTVKLTWYSGGLRPGHLDALPRDFNFPRRGAMYIGSKGVMVSGGSRGLSVFPGDLYASGSKPEGALAPTEGHHRDWIKAIKGGPDASSNFEYGSHLTEITLLGVLSLRLGGKRILWDGPSMSVPDFPDADLFIKEPVRNGWEMV